MKNMVSDEKHAIFGQMLTQMLVALDFDIAMILPNISGIRSSTNKSIHNGIHSFRKKS